jgi:hypothetical protein
LLVNEQGNITALLDKQIIIAFPSLFAETSKLLKGVCKLIHNWQIVLHDTPNSWGMPSEEDEEIEDLSKSF